MTLARRLYDHQIERIRFRLPDRQQRSFTYKTVGISEHHLVIPSIGTIAMRDYRPFPDHAKLHYANVQVDCYGAEYRVDLVLSIELPIAEEQPVHYEKVVGLDYTQNGLYVTNTGENAGYPGYRKKHRNGFAATIMRQSGFTPEAIVGVSTSSVPQNSNVISFISAATGSISRHISAVKNMMQSVSKRWISLV